MKMKGPTAMSNLVSNNKTVFIGLIFLTLLAYLPSFKGEWQYDDIPVIVNSKGTQQSVFNPYFFEGNRFFRSIPYITFAINYKVGGNEPFGFHLINWIIHISSGSLLYLFILELFFTIKIKNGIDYQKFKAAAFLTALLWLVSPINVQAVTYIVQRMTSLAGLFYILAIFLYLKFRNHNIIKGKISWRLLSGLIISAFLAFLSKQNSFLLILTITYIEWSFYRDASLRKYKLFFLLIPALILFLILIIYLFFSSGTDTNVWAVFQNNYTNREFSPLQRLFIEPKILLYYVSLMIFPFVGRFHILYSFDWLNAPHQVMPYISIVLIAVVFIVSVIPKCIRKYKIISFGIFFFLINHLMESSVIGLQLAAEHRNYIPSVGIFLILATGILSLGDKLRNVNIVYLFSGLFILFSIFNTWMLNLKYQEKYCNALYDYNTQYNALDHDVASMAVDKLMYEKDYVSAYKIMAIEYEVITKNPHRNKFFAGYISRSTRFLKFYTFLYYINTGFNVEETLAFIESRFIRDEGNFWNKMKNKKNYDNIFHYFYIKSLLRKYNIIDEATYQKSLQYDPEIIDIYFYFKARNYNEFVKYNLTDIEKLEGLELTENEKRVLELIK